MRRTAIKDISKPVVYTALVGVCFIWGGAFAAIKMLLDVLSPAELVKIRYALAFPFFAVFLLTRNRVELSTKIRAHPWRIIIAAFFGVVGYNISLAFGELEIPSGTASLIINLSPIFALVLAVLFLGEKMTAAKILGMLISMCGVYLLVVTGGGEGPTRTYFVYAFITMLAPLSWAIYTTACKALSNVFDSLTLTSLVMVTGSIPLFFFFRRSDWEAVKSLGALQWAMMIFLSYGCTIIGYSIWTLALRRLPSSKVSVFVYLIPISSLIISATLMNEIVTAGMMVGAGLLLVGVYIVNATKKDRMKEQTPSASAKAA